jgi:hypothetical protein
VQALHLSGTFTEMMFTDLIPMVEKNYRVVDRSIFTGLHRVQVVHHDQHWFCLACSEQIIHDLIHVALECPTEFVSAQLCSR